MFRGIYSLWTPADASAPYDGVFALATWAKLEPRKGDYNWSALDNVANAAVKAGKHFTIGVAAGAVTPSWVNTRKVYLPQARLTVPIPWDLNYQMDFGDMVAALGTHYAGDASLDGVHVTGINTKTGETFLVDNAVDCAPWINVGYTATTLITTYQQILAMFTAAFPTTELSVAFIPGGFPLDGSDIDWGMDVELQLLGGQSSANDGWSSTWVSPGLVGYQSNKPQGANLPAALTLALAQPTAHWFELYTADLNDSTLWPSIAAAQANLKAR
jgi:Beta-galactosidase